MAKSDQRLIPIWFPSGGYNRRFAYQMQPPYSTVQAINVRPDSAGVPSGATQSLYVRERGGSRPGIGKAFSEQLGSGAPVKMLNSIQWIESNALKSRLVAISNGKVYEEEPVGTMAQAATPGSFNTAKVLQSAPRNQILYIADHSDTIADSAATNQPKLFNPATSAVANWTASTAGTIPYGCPCIATWRDRLVLGGGTTAPHLISASKQGDPHDWDFSVTNTAAAWSLSLADAGLMGDIVTALAPHSDDCLIAGCTNSLWIFRGDPGFGGTVDCISRHVGIIDRGAWCVTPDGFLVFLSLDGLWAVPAGCSASTYPQSLSREKMPEELLNVDRSSITVAMGYDLRDRGIHIFLTPNSAGSASATHWWFDWEAKSFWKSVLGSADYEPFTIHARTGYVPSSAAYSSTVLGCRDGYIRRHQTNLVTDDSTAFDSEVWLGPFGDNTLFADSSLDEIMGVLARHSGKVTVCVYAGDSPEDAFNSTLVEEFTWVAGRNPATHPRVRGQSIYLKLSNGDDLGWAYETGYLRIRTRGRTRP